MNDGDYKALVDENELLRGQVSQLLEQIEDLRRERDSLQETLAKLQRLTYGKKSEKLDPAQLMLDLEGEARLAEEVPLPKHGFVDEAPDAEDGPAQEKRLRHPGRTPLPVHLPRRRKEIHPAPEDRICSCCHKEMTAIGEEITEQLGRIPARFFVWQYVRVKYACPDCQEGVVRPELPSQTIEKGKAGEDVLADVLVSKYADHLPLHRQSRIFKREGVELSRSTLCQWVGDCSGLLSPIVDQMHRDVLASHVIQSDDTPVKYQDTDARRVSKQGYLWSYVGDRGDVVYRFNTSRGKKGPTTFLDGFKGVLQVDGYPGYNEILSREGITYQGCWAHARRKFFDARDTAPQEGAMVMLMIKFLYQVEVEAEEQKLKPPEIAALRAEKAQPMLDKLKAYLLELQQRPVLPQSPLGKAVAYTLGRWEALCLYIADGRLVIDNNSCERSMRRVAVGRKNWLFTGSAAGGHRAAVIYSLIESCARLGINPHEYLTDVLRKVSTHPQSRIAELTPRGWQASRLTDADTSASAAEE
jgi:transposase